jgi:hypothetical protein
VDTAAVHVKLIQTHRALFAKEKKRKKKRLQQKKKGHVKLIQPHRALQVAHSVCQYSYFCTSKASKLALTVP